jgi:hypothetical protein
MKKTCSISGVEFEVTDADLAFYKKMGVPVPTLCPDERQRRRMSWRNERVLYQRSCDLCQKAAISIYPVKTKFPVYCLDCWRGDRGNFEATGQEFDFSRSFFEQFEEVLNKTPHRALFISGENENSDFTNCAGSNKNCYLLMGNSGGNEDCLFGSGVSDSRDCLDVYFGQKITQASPNFKVEGEIAHPLYSQKKDPVSEIFSTKASDFKNKIENASK